MSGNSSDQESSVSDRETPESASASQGATLQAITAVVLQYRGLLILFVASAAITSLILTFVVSESYKAGSMVLYRPTHAVEMRTFGGTQEKTAFGFPAPASPSFETVGATIERVATSPRVLGRVVEELGLDKPEVNNEQGLWWYFEATKDFAKQCKNDALQLLKYGRLIETDPTTDAIIGLMKSTEIETKENYATKLEVTDNDPKRAALIVDRIANVLVEELRELSVQVVRQRASELEKRLLAKKQQIDDVHSKIEQLKTAGGFILLQEEMTLHLGTIEQFERELLENGRRLSEAQAQLTALNAQRQLLESNIPSSQTTEDDPLYAELDSQRARFDIELQGLLGRRGPKHSDVHVLKDQLNKVKNEMTQLVARRVASEVTAKNPAHEQILIEEIKVESQVAGLNAANQVLMDSILSLRDLTVAPSVVSEMAKFELDQEVLEAEYTHLASAVEEAKTEMLTDLPEVRVLFSATPLPEPVRPIKVYHVAVSGILALFLGLGTIFVLDFLGTAWYTPLWRTSIGNDS